MTTTSPTPLPSNDIDANIRTNTRVLMAHRQIKGSALWPSLGLTRATFSARMTGAAKWTAAEVIRLAQLLNVSVETLAMDPDQLLRTGRFATHRLSLVAGGSGGDGRPRRTGHLRAVR